jgi:hypothetical protein
MKVVLLGATGFVGSALLKEALDRGHRVTAIVRNTEHLEKRDGLVARTGDVYDTASLAGLIEGNDALISAFNPGRTQISMTTRSGGQGLSFRPSRRQPSSESSGWPGPVAWRSSRECVWWTIPPCPTGRGPAHWRPSMLWISYEKNRTLNGHFLRHPLR